MWFSSPKCHMIKGIRVEFQAKVGINFHFCSHGCLLYLPRKKYTHTYTKYLIITSSSFLSFIFRHFLFAELHWAVLVSKQPAFVEECHILSQQINQTLLYDM